MSTVPEGFPAGAVPAAEAAADAAASSSFDSSTASLIAEIHAGLAYATDERGIIDAVAQFATRVGACSLHFMYVHSDNQGVPQELQGVASWELGTAGGRGEPFMGGRRVPLSELSLSQLWINKPEEPLIVPDTQREPRTDEAFRTLSASLGHHALVALPVYSRSQQCWLGVFFLAWPEPHAPSPAERFVYGVLTQSLVAFVANRRAVLAQQEMLREVTALSAMSTRLSAATNLDEALRAAIAWAVDNGANSASLATIHTDAAGQPSQMEIVSEWFRNPGAYPSAIGQRFNSSEVQVSKHWIETPDLPVLIDDVRTDPRVDPVTADVFVHYGVRASALLALRNSARWVGLITISWPEPRTFTAQDHRFYRSIASQAAMVFQNRLLFAQMQEALVENQRQRNALQAMLDHMPTGLFVVEVPSGTPQLINIRGTELLGRGADPAADKNNMHEVYQAYFPGTEQPMAGSDLPIVRTMATGQPATGEMDIVRPDGTRINIEVYAAPILDENGVMNRAVALFLDVSARKRAESERGRMQDELIKVQAAALAERSTPLIPITDEIMVLPLIGSLDTERGQQIIDVLLTGVSESRARVAIIDITGVRTLDTLAANALTNAAQALRLLGVEPVLTGIRAEVAQTLVSLGVPLAGIVTRSTLQSGIAYANRARKK